MAVDMAVDLVAGQPVKYRYAGFTPDGAENNKSLYGIMSANDYLMDFFRNDPSGFLKMYSDPSAGTQKFLRGVVGHWCINFSDDFDSWYKDSSADVKDFLYNIGLRVSSDGRFSVGTYNLPPVPPDMPLPQELKEKISAHSKRVDDDHGHKDFTYGVYLPQGNWPVVQSFALIGEGHEWCNMDSASVDDPNYAREVVPVSKEEMLAGLNREILSYGLRIEKGGLEGAVDARKQFLLTELYKKIADAAGPADILGIMESDLTLPAPGTGVYVIMQKKGSRMFGNTETFELSALKAVPRYDERKVAQLMSVLLEDDAYSQFDFTAFEVPASALDLVKDPRTLEARLR